MKYYVWIGEHYVAEINTNSLKEAKNTIKIVKAANCLQEVQDE